jgi:hypothetical protein
MPLGDALFTVLTGGAEDVTMEGYFLLSLAVSVLAYIAGAEADRRTIGAAAPTTGET